jgi:hypothetical protein
METLVAQFRQVDGAEGNSQRNELPLLELRKAALLAGSATPPDGYRVALTDLSQIDAFWSHGFDSGSPCYSGKRPGTTLNKSSVWRGVEAISHELLRKRKLSGKECKRLFDEAAGDAHGFFPV